MKLHPVPNCVIVYVWLLISMLPVRLATALFGATVYDSVPLPVVPEPAFSAIQGVLVLAVQVHVVPKTKVGPALAIDLNAKVLGVMLGIECLIIAIMDVVFVAKPGPQGVSFHAFLPSSVPTAGAGAAFCFLVASFMGFESAPVYAEETHRPAKSIGRATYWAVGIIGVFYAISTWAMTVAIGPDKIVGAAGDSLQNGGNLLLDTSAAKINVFFSEVGNVFLITSLFAALLSFHNAVARYFFAMGRERLLPQALGRTNSSSGAPALGSLLQTLIAAAVVISFAALKKDPILTLFTWGGNCPFASC